MLLMLSGLISIDSNGQTPLTIGTGTSTNQFYPIYTYYGYNYSQSTYLATEIVSAGAIPGTPGYISSISYNITTYLSDFSTYCKDWDIYMGNTSKTTFSGTTDWVPLSGLTKVYSGTVTPTGTGWVKITFTTPFYWNGTSNLVVGVDENTPGYTSGSGWRWQQTTRTGTRSISYYSDPTNPNPATPPTANTTYAGTPNIKLDYTAAIPCSGVTTGGSTAVTPTTICPGGSVTLSVTGGSTGTGLVYAWESGPSITGPWTTITGTTATLTVTPPSGTTFYRRKITCTSTSSSAYSTPISILSPLPLSPPYTETFESATVGINIPCASYTGGWSDGQWWYIRNTAYSSATNHTPGGSKYLLGGWYLECGSGSQEFWFTPGISLSTGKTYRFSYWYINDGYPYYNPATGAYIGTSQTRTAMSAIGPFINTTNTSYKQYSTDFSVPSNSVYYIGVRVRSTYNYGFGIDDLNLIELPPCNTAVSFASGGKSNATPNVICSIPGTTTLSVSSTPPFSGLKYEWQRSDGTPSFATPIAAGTTATVTNTITATGTYYYRCKITCTSTGVFAYSDTTKVTTTPIIPPYIETFESGSGGVNMPCASYTYYFGADWAWNIRTTSYPSWSGATLDNHTPGGSKYLIGGSDLGYWSGVPEYWFTPAIQFTSGKLYQLSYWYQTDGEPGCIYTLASYMGLSQTPGAMTIPIGTSFTTTTKVYKQFKHQFTSSISGNYYIGIQKNQSNYGNGVAIDDIGLQEVPPCSSTVIAGTINSDPTHICNSGGTTTLDLTGTTLATGLTYEVLYSDKEFGTYVSGGVITLPYTTDPLTQDTWFKIIVNCKSSGKKDTTKAFYVGIGAFEMPYVEDFESTPSGDKPLCSDATKWGDYYYDGWYVASDGVIGTPYLSHTPGGKNFLVGGYYLGSPLSVSEDNYWFTPGLKLKTGYRYNLSFYYLSSYSTSYRNKLGVYIGKSQTIAGMTSTIANYRVINNITYQLLDTIFNVPSDGIYYIGFRKSGSAPTTTYSYEGVAIDDINLNYAPCNGKPIAGIVTSSISTPSCKGTMVTLTDIGATINLVPGIKYQWQRKPFSSTTWSNVIGATDTILKSDTLIGYDYRLAVICKNTNDTSYTPSYPLNEIPGHPPVTISPMTSPIVYCLGDSIKFNATSFAGGVYEWTRDSIPLFGWKFGDFTATEPGTYMVKTISPLSACPVWSNKVKLIENDPGYTVSITTPSDSFICEGKSILLTGSSSKPGVTYQWRRNNVDISGSTSPSYLVTTSGYYRLTTNDGISSCKAGSRNVYINVYPNPIAKILIPGGTTTACENEGVLLKSSSGYSHEWMRGGSTIAGWIDSIQLIKNSGVYSVKVRSSDGCVSVSSPVTINIIPSPSPIISNVGFKLTVIGSYSSYQWVRNGTDIPGEVSSTITISKKGKYQIKVTDFNNCEGLSNTLEFDDNELSINDLSLETIKIYPNPSDSRVYIETPVSIRLDIRDVNGKSVYKTTINSNRGEVDMSKFSDGNYIYMISDINNQLIKKQTITKITSK